MSARAAETQNSETQNSETHNSETQNASEIFVIMLFADKTNFLFSNEILFKSVFCFCQATNKLSYVYALENNHFH